MFCAAHGLRCVSAPRVCYGLDRGVAPSFRCSNSIAGLFDALRRPRDLTLFVFPEVGVGVRHQWRCGFIHAAGVASVMARHLPRCVHARLGADVASSVSTSCVASWVYRRCVSRHGSILDLHAAPGMRGGRHPSSGGPAGMRAGAYFHRSIDTDGWSLSDVLVLVALGPLSWG